MGDEPRGFVIRVEGVGGVVRARLFEGDVHSMCIGGVLARVVSRLLRILYILRA